MARLLLRTVSIEYAICNQLAREWIHTRPARCGRFAFRKLCRLALRWPPPNGRKNGQYFVYPFRRLRFVIQVALSQRMNSFRPYLFEPGIKIFARGAKMFVICIAEAENGKFQMGESTGRFGL